ncbi:LppU/SCO3897 family protein [Couchioplanes caeruleus]|uniref:Uncharacterized protein n=1 Tax=Couchioplanes caeruleus subsp. caeruleus TaxID=56427 RepID=A0A1K0FPG9_9ACTN|nr:hypothetical protein [Couchioplanes caeruleus]OJF14689.1 hypothetical protein BG844_08620 [Couchioplanes caeruleus subsp. caeruleus]
MGNLVVRRVAAAVVALATLVIVGSLLAPGDAAEDAAVGDCLSASAAHPGAKLVGCAEAAAAFTVVGRVDGESDSASRSCERFFEADEEYFLYTSTAGDGYLLCLRRAG